MVKCLVHSVQQLKGNSQIAVRFSKVWLYLYRPLEVLHRLIYLTATCQHNAEVVAGHPTIGISLDCRSIERLDV